MKIIGYLLILSFPCAFLSAQNVQLTIEGQLQIKKEAAENLILQSDAVGWGSWVKPANQQRQIIDVTDFGAVGDSQTDNTTAFQNAIDHAASLGGGTVYIPPGNFIISQTINVPGGVVLQGESESEAYHRTSTTPFKGSTIMSIGEDFVVSFSGFFSGAQDLFFYRIGASPATDKGCIKLVADDGTFSTGYNRFANLVIYGFEIGTSMLIQATNNSTIAHVMIEDVLLRFPETGLHIEESIGSTIEHVTLLNGKIGGGFKYSFRNQGGTNINVYGTTFEGSGCGSFGHLVIESGNVNAYGFRTESTDPHGTCDESAIPIIHCFPNTTGSYIQGLTGDGRVIDEGANHLDVTGANIGRRPSGYNEFQNSAFRGVLNNAIPNWDLTGNVSNITVVDPVFEKDNQVLTMTIPAGEIVSLSPTIAAMPKAMNHQFGAFGAYIKTNTANIAFSQINSYQASTNTCTPVNASFHTGDNQWQYISLPTGINGTVCDLAPRFVFDNTGNSASTVSITCPAFVFGNARPSLAAKPLLNVGGIMDGTLTTGMTTLPIVVNSTSEFTLPPDGNTFLLTGTTAIHRLNNSTALGYRFPKGTIITLVFESPGVVVRNWAYINLTASGNYTSTAGSSLSLLALDGGVWREIGRNL